MMRTIYTPVSACQHCGTTGMGATGWTDICPNCAASPARRAWYDQMRTLHTAMKTEAAHRKLGPGRVAITPQIQAQWEALGPQPV